MTRQTRERRELKSIRAFTLIEMLVVVSILSILAMLLLPSLSKALKSARSLSCANNMKQISIGFAFYANATNGWIPPTYYPAGNLAPLWADEICRVGMGLTGYPDSYMIAANEYLPVNQLGVWNCPENDKKNSFRCGWAQLFTCYGINGWNNTTDTNEGRAAGLRVSSIRNPSQLYQLLESTYYRSEAWFNDGATVIPTELQGLGASRVRYPHSSGMNILYVDGHLNYAPYPVLPRGSVNSSEYYKWYHK